jgi:hypothetical protein
MLLRDEFFPRLRLQIRIDADPSAELERRHIVNEFASNVERHRRELLLHCYRMLGPLPDAEDAVQETLLRAWRYSDSLKEGAPAARIIAVTSGPAQPSRIGHWIATPSTINRRPFTAARRIGLIAAYAGESYQACACSEVSNAMTTIPLGGASPSRLSVLPPRTTK